MIHLIDADANERTVCHKTIHQSMTGAYTKDDGREGHVTDDIGSVNCIDCLQPSPPPARSHLPSGFESEYAYITHLAGASAIVDAV